MHSMLSSLTVLDFLVLFVTRTPHSHNRMTHVTVLLASAIGPGSVLNLLVHNDTEYALNETKERLVARQSDEHVAQVSVRVFVLRKAHNCIAVYDQRKTAQLLAT